MISQNPWKYDVTKTKRARFPAGKVVAEVEVQSQVLKIDLSSYAKGHYILKAYENKIMVGSQRVLIK